MSRCPRVSIEPSRARTREPPPRARTSSGGRLGDDPQLSESIRAEIVEGRNRVFVQRRQHLGDSRSKRVIGKLEAPVDLVAQLERARLQPLDITIEHSLAVGAPPDHHTDPFDRFLVAQARTERLTLVTRAPRILQYEVDALEA